MNQKGFSLLELSIAVAILGFILYGFVLSQSSLREFNSQKDNKVLMEEVREVFHTFVQVNGFLPCPDIDNDGREDRNPDGDAIEECSRHYGGIPYLDLGILDSDEWFGSLYYAVNQEADDDAAIDDSDTSASYFNNALHPNTEFDINTPPVGALNDRSNNSLSPETTLSDNWGNYIICGESATACDGSTPNDDIIEHSAVAVVVSFGDNGPSPTSPVEQVHTDHDDYFWQAKRSITENQEFDDQLFWLTGYDVKYAIIRSEKGLIDLP